jgi:hypothetical protein
VQVSAPDLIVPENVEEEDEPQDGKKKKKRRRKKQKDTTYPSGYMNPSYQ